MKMPSLASVFCLAAVILFGATGCTSHTRTARIPAGARTCTLVVSVQGEPPSPAQLEFVRVKAAELLQPRGWTLVDDPADAEAIATIELTPDATDPEHKGTTRFVSMASNPRYRRYIYAQARPIRYSEPITYDTTFPYDYYYRTYDPYDSRYGGTHSRTGDHGSRPPPNNGNTGGTTPPPQTPPPTYHRPPRDDSGRHRYQPDDSSNYTSSSPSSSSDNSSSGGSYSSSSSSSSSSSFDSGSSSSSSSPSFSSSAPESHSDGGSSDSRGHSAQPN